MKFAHVDMKYVDYLSNKINHVQKHTFGLVIYSSGLHYFIPISSKYAKFLEREPNHIKDNEFEIVKNTRGRKVAVLKIDDYYIVDRHSLNFHIKETPLIKAEIEYVRKNEFRITDKLMAVTQYKRRRHRQLSKYSQDYYSECSKSRSTYKAFAKRNINEAVRSMSLVEEIENYVEFIPEVVKNSNIPGMKTEDVDTFSISKIKNLKIGWEFMLDNLEKDIDINFLIEINSLVSRDDALYTGCLRKSEGYVNGTHVIAPPNPRRVEKNINDFLAGDFDSPERIHNIFEFYIYMVINQLFVDGNKRTAFIVLNKLLVQNSIGIVIIDDSNIEIYNDLLSNHYTLNSNQTLDSLIKFLKDECLLYA